MATEEKQVKRALLDVLFETKRICDKNDIKYFLVGGTLIGAVRHQGFIPWDDDIDVGMLRKDYERFLCACQIDLNPKYTVSLWNSEPDNPNVYAKIKIKGTTYIEKQSANTNQSKEIFIDIFPFDNSPDNPKEAQSHGRKIAFYRRLLAIKCGVDFAGASSLYKRIANRGLKLLSILYSQNQLYKKNLELCTRYDNLETHYIVNACGTYNYMKERNKREIFESFVEMPFESGMFMTVAQYDEYLSSIYGDYMRLPPESQRTSRHGTLKIDLGEYVPTSVMKEDLQ